VSAVQPNVPVAHTSPYALAVGDQNARVDAAPHENLTANRRGERRTTAPPPPRAHSVNDACAMLGISRAMLYKLKAKGGIQFIKIGRRALIPVSEIDRLVATGAP
jgi:excisionase family DNA binding protein